MLFENTKAPVTLHFDRLGPVGILQTTREIPHKPSKKKQKSQFLRLQAKIKLLEFKMDSERGERAVRKKIKEDLRAQSQSSENSNLSRAAENSQEITYDATGITDEM